MKILKPIRREEIGVRRGNTDYSQLLEQLKDLPVGLSLPVECKDVKEAVNVQYYCFRVLNPVNMYGSKWATVRRKSTVFITRAENVEVEHPPERKSA